MMHDQNHIKFERGSAKSNQTSTACLRSSWDRPLWNRFVQVQADKL